MIYLDNSSTTRCFPEAAKAMTELMCTDFGNPSSAHHLGVVAEKRIREAKESLASQLRCQPSELIFTSGGTESDNLAILGAARAGKRNGMHVVTTVIEHPAVLRTMEQLQDEGYDVTYLPVDKDGLVSLESVERAISEDTVLLSIMHTNNEIGSVQPIATIGALLKRKYPRTLFHVDAVQGFGKARIYPKELGVDLMSVSSHKIHGPKGVGLLYVASGKRIAPIIFGGGQQNGLRSGTENVPGIVGMALAAEKLSQDLETDRERLYSLKTGFVKELLRLENVRINGIPGMKDGRADNPEDMWQMEARISETAPHIVSASFRGVRAEVLLHALEEKGIYVSAGSACATHKPEPSRTLQAIGLKKEQLEGTLRFSFSIDTTEKELAATIKALQELLPELRRFTAK
ncbi:MAG: cysteine desulfurase [Lachnospiraceae bacterium]|nr:cysteine desulfurase [Lachnospiraceae bacterium]